MGEAPVVHSINAPFPAPPPFYHTFTAENLARLTQLEANAPGDLGNSSSELPQELRNLRPPTPPINGEYRCFGEQRSLIAKLPPVPPEARILPQPQDASLRTPVPSPSNLLTLTRSLLLSYLELLHILTSNPDASEYGPKWEDLRDLFQNAHSVLNAYRGWQGREALIRMMESQIARAKENIREWDEVENKAREILDHLTVRSGEGAEDVQLDSTVANPSQAKKVEERRMWAMLEAI